MVSVSYIYIFNSFLVYSCIGSNKVVQVHGLALICPIFQTLFIKYTVFASLLLPCSYITWPCGRGCMSRPSLYFHRSMWLFLRQYHSVWITVPLSCVLKPGSLDSVSLFFTLDTVLTNHVLCGSTCIVVCFSLSILYKSHRAFDRSCTESVDHFGSYWKSNIIKSSNPWTQCVISSICVFLKFFQQCFPVIIEQVVHPLRGLCHCLPQLHFRVRGEKRGLQKTGKCPHPTRWLCLTQVCQPCSQLCLQGGPLLGIL